MRTPVYILLIHYLTLEGRGGLERLHASWGLREDLAGDRAPPRGVDVKQPPPGRPPRGHGAESWGSTGPLGPGRVPRPGPGIRDPVLASPGGLPRPGGGLSRPPDPEVRDRPPPRGGFYINPSRRGPVPGPGGPPPEPGFRSLRDLPGRSESRPARPGPESRKIPGQGPAARG